MSRKSAGVGAPLCGHPLFFTFVGGHGGPPLRSRIVWSFVFVFVSLIGITHPLFALEIPERPAGYVTDEAGLLSPPVRQRLEYRLADYERKTTNQVVVAAFPSLEGESLEDFSIRLAEKWKIGQAGRDNGAIFLIFKADRKMRIEVGYGLEGT